jgi:hypothetical protein
MERCRGRDLMKRLLPILMWPLFLTALIAQAQLPMHPLPFGTVGTACSSTATTWNPSDKSADITLSNSNLTASQSTTTGSWRSVRSTSSKSTGKLYFEITMSAYDNGNGWIWGFSDGSSNLSSFSGSDTHSVGCQVIVLGNSYYNGSTPSASGDACATWSSFPANEVISTVVDIPNALMCTLRSSSGVWAGHTGGCNPATGANMMALKISSPIYIQWSGIRSGGTTDSGILNTSGCVGNAFTNAIPSGYTAWK